MTQVIQILGLLSLVISKVRPDIFKSKLLDLSNQCTFLLITLSSNTTTGIIEEDSTISSLHDLNPLIIFNFEQTQLESQSPLKRPNFFKASSCITTILTIEDTLNDPNYTSFHLDRLLIPVLRPMILKNKEKVVLTFSKKSSMNDNFLKSSFGKKLKYKIATTVSSDQKVNYKTSCEFCQDKNIIFPANLDGWKDFEDNFQQTILRVSTPITSKPRLNYTMGKDGKYQMANGLLGYVVLYMKKRLNFTIELRPASRGGGTGIKLPNGTWTGVMSDVLYGESDIGMCTAETFGRSLVVGFTPAVVIEPITFVSGPPQRIFVWQSIFWPFTSTLWSYLGVVIITFVILMRFTFCVLPIPKKNIWTAGEVFEFIIRILLTNAGRIPQNVPQTINVYIVLWLLCGFVFTIAYLSKLVGFLTFPLLEKVPQTAEELAESKFGCGLTFMGGAAYGLIKASKTKTYEKILAKMELTTDHIQCLTRTLESKFICISYETIPKFYLNSKMDLQPDQSPLIVSQNYFISVPVGIAMEKRAVFSPNIDKLVRSADTAGLITQWEKLDFRRIRMGILDKQKTQRNTIGEKKDKGKGKTDAEKKEEKEENRSLTIKHLHGAFIVLSAGIVVSFTIFLWESFIKKYGVSVFKGLK